MKCRFFMGLLAVTAMVAVNQDAFGQELRQSVAAETPASFTGEKTSWHGFDRFDFLMDDAALTVQPIKASPDEENGINGQVKGQLRCVVVVPKEAAPGKPWSWRGRYFDHEPQAEIELLKRGFHIGFIQSDAGKQWDAWYTFLTEKHGLSKKPAFIGMSGGGRNAFTWATTNPDKVSCIYADNPLITRESLMKLGELAQRDVPLLHICGSLDPLSGNHTLPVESIYQQLGGRISVMIKDGAGHHPHSLRDPTLIADFIVRSLEPAAGLTRVRRQEVHQVIVLRRREHLPRLSERRDVHHLSRTVVLGFLRPLRIQTRQHDRDRSRHCAEDGSPWEALGASGRTSSLGMQWSIWPCCTKAFTSSPALAPGTPMARFCKSGTPFTNI